MTRSILFVFSLSIVVAIFNKPAEAQSLSQAERTRIEHYGEQYIAALNAGAAAFAKTIDAIYAASTLAKIGNARIQQQMERLHNDLGAVEFHHAEIAEFNMGGAISRVLHVYAKPSGAAMWRDFQFRLEANSPFKRNTNNSGMQSKRCQIICRGFTKPASNSNWARNSITAIRIFCLPG